MMRGRVAVLALALACAGMVPLRAQPPGGPGGPPPPPKNLQVLPKDWTRDQVTAVMRGFANALGVRCTHCHVGQDGNPQSMDYAADEKHEKEAARQMLKMVNTINTEFVSKVAEGDATAAVRCETCHRGRSHPPRPLADLLAETAARDGADAAVAKYTEMRTESLESGQYDFRARSVLNAARRLQDEKQAESATSLLKGAVALFPNSADVAATLGMALLQGGDRDGAKTQFDRALAIDPKNGQAQQGLRRLQGGPGGRP
jgi:tetratricopeptide (TPR) repeat protein